MRAKSLALLTLALGCGLVASIGITQVMAKRSTTVTVAGATENIYVAARDVPLNEVLSVGLLKLEQWPKDKVPPGAIGKLEDIEGRRCRTRLYAGEAILKTKLFGKGQDLGGSSSQIPKGMRVVPVRVDAVSGGSGLILPGDRVDLLVHLLANPSAGIREPCTRTVLQNIKVFAADSTTDLERVNGDGKSIQAKTISLLVTPDQAQKITLASELGQVRLVMRSPEDDTQTKVDGVTPRELFGIADSGKLTKDEAPQGAPKAAVPEEFMAMLKAMQAKQAAPPTAQPVAAPPAPERYRMRLLTGEQRGEAVFESRVGSAKDAWTLVSEVVPTPSKAEAAKPVATPPAPEKANGKGQGKNEKADVKPATPAADKLPSQS
jgi:pilus assembly protein CpaB